MTTRLAATVPEYPPCKLSLSQLAAMRVSDLKLGKHHCGQYLPVKVKFSATEAADIVAVDEYGESVSLIVPHLDPLAGSADAMPVGSIVCVKEPFVCEASLHERRPSVYVVHISNIVWQFNVSGHIPSSWRPEFNHSEMTTEELRREADNAFKAGRYHDAIQIYTTALHGATLAADAAAIRLNRSLVYLVVNHHEAALHDATNATDASGTEAQGAGPLYASQALYKLGRFQECQSTLEALSEKSHDDETIAYELSRVKIRLHEQSTGSYDFQSLQQQVLDGHLEIDCATYAEPVVVQPSEGCGRGLFAAKAVKAGDLLLAEKAFVYSGHTLASVSALRPLASLGVADLVATLAIQKMLRNPSVAPSINALYSHEDKTEAEDAELVDGQPVIDSYHVRRIVKYDAFDECPASTFIWHHDILPLSASMAAEARALAQFQACGLWPTASYINHSCIGNVNRTYIGDLLLLRATRDIAAGEELLFNYAGCCPGCDKSLAKLRKWGFECRCPLCEARALTSRNVLDARELLLAEVKTTAKTLTPSNMNSRIAFVSTRLLKLVKDMDPLFRPPGAPQRSPTEVPFVELVLALDDLAGMYNFVMGRVPADECRRLSRSCIISSLNELSAMGYLTRHGDPMKKDSENGPPLEVLKWGCFVNDELALHLWMRLTQAYLHSHWPMQHFEAARANARKVYAMVVGEAATIEDVYADYWTSHTRLRERDILRLREHEVGAGAQH